MFVRGQEIATLRGQLASTAQAPERLRGLARAGVPRSDYVSWAQRVRPLQMKEYQLWKALSEQLKRYRADVKKTLGQMSVEWAKHTAKLVAGVLAIAVHVYGWHSPSKCTREGHSVGAHLTEAQFRTPLGESESNFTLSGQ